MSWLAYVLLILLLACLGLFCYLVYMFWKEEGKQDESSAKVLQQTKKQSPSQ